MKNKNRIPDVPDLKKVPETIHQNILNWVEHFRAISSRIDIQVPTQDLLDSYEHRLRRKLADGDDIKDTMIEDWPKLEEIAFILRFDSSLVGGEKLYLLENTSFFLKSDVAYPLSHFDYGGDELGISWYSLANWDADVLTWHFREERIVGELIYIQRQIPPLHCLTGKGPIDSRGHVVKGS